jgi:LEA14-like dessication related protein
MKLLKFKSLLFTFLLVSLAISFQSCTGIEEVKIGEIQSVNIKGMKGNIVTVEMSAHLTNPNHFSIKLTRADLSLSANGNTIGSIKRIDPLVIPGNSDESQKLTFDLELSTGILGAFGMMSGYRNGFNLGLDGTIHLRYFMFGKTLEIKESRRVDNIGIQ